jgi:hypothetical protein
MNDSGSILVAHCGARKVTREELKDFSIPNATRTHQPLSHFQITEVLEEALSYRYLKVVRDEYAVSPDGMKMFGVMDLNTEFGDVRFSVGLRNSNDKSMRFALTVGYRVFVCDNMAFSGNFTPLLHKHTKSFNLEDSISIAVDRIQRSFLPLGRKLREMREISLSENQAKLLIYEAFMDGNIKGLPRHLMPSVHELYFEPQYKAFYPRNIWSLSNAFTSAFKKLVPIKQFEFTAKFGAFLGEAQERLQNEKTLHFVPKAFTPPSQLKQLAGVVNNETPPFETVYKLPVHESDSGDIGDYFDREVEDASVEEAVFDDEETEKLVERYESQAA